MFAHMHLAVMGGIPGPHHSFTTRASQPVGHQHPICVSAAGHSRHTNTFLELMARSTWAGQHHRGTTSTGGTPPYMGSGHSRGHQGHCIRGMGCKTRCRRSSAGRHKRGLGNHAVEPWWHAMPCSMHAFRHFHNIEHNIVQHKILVAFLAPLGWRTACRQGVQLHAWVCAAQHMQQQLLQQRMHAARRHAHARREAGRVAGVF